MTERHEHEHGHAQEQGHSHGHAHGGEAVTRVSMPLSAGGPADWGVILLGHGSQRGASPRECSCAWQQPSDTNGDRANDCTANGNGSSVADLPGWPAWCRRCPNTPQGLTEVAERLQAELGSEKAQVLLSCLEFIQPFPDEAVRLLSQQGMNRVVVMPYLLGNGKHATLEMYEMLDDLRSQLPQVELNLAEGLGSDERLASLIVDRIGDMDEAAPAPGAGRTVGIHAGKGGNQDPIRRLSVAGRSWARWSRNEWVKVTLLTWPSPTTATPTMEYAAGRLIEERGVSAIICVPYIFFPGLILTRNVLGTLDRLRQEYPNVSMTVAPPLGVDDRLVAVAADRVRQVWSAA